MNVRINPELWNTLTPVQKRALAENLLARPRRFADAAELTAWATALAATALVAAFAFLLV